MIIHSSPPPRCLDASTERAWVGDPGLYSCVTPSARLQEEATDRCRGVAKMGAKPSDGFSFSCVGGKNFFKGRHAAKFTNLFN